MGYQEVRQPTLLSEETSDSVKNPVLKITSGQKSGNENETNHDNWDSEATAPAMNRPIVMYQHCIKLDQAIEKMFSLVFLLGLIRISLMWKLKELLE